jgi:hypothetical protein
MTITVLDPVAQTFIIDKESFPEGTYLSSVRLFFRSKPTSNIPIQISIVGTLNGFPTGRALDYSQVTLFPSSVKTSENPQYLDSNTYTEFRFPVPVYINPNSLYAIVIQSNTSGYKLWAAAQDDIPLASSVKETPTSTTPTSLTKISKSPYSGSFFESQNGITYTPDQTKDLMFVINRCRFSTGTSPSINFVIPAGLQNTKQIEQTFTKATSNVAYDELNLSTTQFIPTGTSINYTYTTTLQSDGTSVGPTSVIPGDYGTPLPRNIYLDDNRGSRVLVANSNTSFVLNATLTTNDNRVSPILADDGVRLYTVKYSINNMGLSNSDISIVDSGIGYLSNTSGILSSPNIDVSAPDEADGEQAFVSANVVSGNIVSVFVTTQGSGYTKTPTITVSATANTTAIVQVNGETSSFGGNGLARYLTYPVTLSQGNDSGDLRVFLTAYRPVGTNIHIYYKILAREDTQNFDDGDWQKMTIVGSSTKFSRVRNDLYEYTAAPGINGIADNTVSYTSKESGITYTQFFKYAIKIVLSSRDSTIVPEVKDIRVIALPEGSGL